MRLTLLAILLCMTPGVAQQPFPQDAPTVKFEASAQLVVEMVTVKDKNGAVIEGLGAKDFTVTENGAPQTIRFCEFQKLQESPDAAPRAAPPTTQPVTRNQIAPEPPGGIRYKDRRLLVLYFDMSAMQPPEQFRALAAARKFIRTQMTPQDL